MLGEFTLEANVTQIDSADRKVTTGALLTTVLYKKGRAETLLVYASKNICSEYHTKIFKAGKKYYASDFMKLWFFLVIDFYGQHDCLYNVIL